MAITNNLPDGQAPYQHNWTPEQDLQFQFQHAQTTHESAHGPYPTISQISNFDIVSFDKQLQQPFASTRIQSEYAPRKRRRVSIEHDCDSATSKDGYTNFIHGQYPVSPPQLNPEMQASFQHAGLANSEYATDCYQSLTLSNKYASPSQQPAVPANIHLLSPSQNNIWARARERRRRVHEPPQIDPNDDPTIAEVEQEAEYWVNELRIAMLNTKDVKDPEASHARKLFLFDAAKEDTETNWEYVELACREIFCSLIDRCRNGFRAPRRFNKAFNPHRGLEADKTALCRERIDNVVDVLTWNKRVCKDVLYEDWKIRLLVNHPLAYDKEKDSQKGSNDHRRSRMERLIQAKEELEKLRKVKQQQDCERGA